MELIDVIRNRCSVRKYKDIQIPKWLIDKITEAGRFGPSVHGFQPWQFVVITNASARTGIANILLKKSDVLDSGISKSLHLTAKTIANAPLVILVYNTNILRDVSLKLYKINKKYIKIAELSEIQSIAAAIQNMILVADNLGIGSCWNTIPLFCEKRINNFVGNHDQLLAVITMGYPAEKSERTPRKPINNIITFLH